MNVRLERVRGAGTDLAVLVYEARRPRDVAIVVGHGYSSSKQNLDGLCAFLASHGFGVWSLDFPGHKLGASGGVLRSAHDLIAAMAATVAHARRAGATRVYALGHSMGATAALLTAAADPSLLGVISIAAGYGRPAALDALAARGVVDLRSSYVDGLSLAEVAQAWQPLVDAALPQLGARPKLFIAAERDMMVTRASVEALVARVPAPATLLSIASDHTFAGDNARSAVLGWLDGHHRRVAPVDAAPPTAMVDLPL